MTRTPALTLLVLASAVTAAACDLSTNRSSGSPFGVGIITTHGTSGAYTITPSIAFYRVAGASLINTNVSADTCFITNYSAAGDSTSGFAETVSAGTFVVVSAGAGADTLTRTNVLDPFYRATAALALTPGDTLTVKVPGDPNGFPTSTFLLRTAEDFTVDPISSIVEGDDVPVSWTPAPVPGSAMLMSFRFASPEASQLDSQVACSFIDDGSAVVPGGTMANWVRATIREAQAERVRSIITQIDVPRAYFNLASVFVQTMTTP